MEFLQEDDKKLWNFLLGDATIDEQEELEQRLLTEDSLLDHLEIVEEELLDDYVSGKLNPSERSKVESYFLCTDERRRKLSLATALNRYATNLVTDSPQETKAEGKSWLDSLRLFFSPLRIAFASVILLVGLGTVVWRVFLYKDETTKGMVALNAAYRNGRPTEARITEMNYAPPINERGGGNSRVDENMRDLASALLGQAVTDEPGTESNQALGRYLLTDHQYDRAIAQFETALQAVPTDPLLHSDLAAAYLERGKTNPGTQNPGRNQEDFGRCIEETHMALDTNPSLLEPLYNRALCHEYMMLPLQAAEDWRLYLENDKNSQWSEEAKHRLKLLEEEKNPSDTTSKRSLLDAFTDAYHARDTETAWKVYSRNHTPSGNSLTKELQAKCLQVTGPEWDDCISAFKFLGEIELAKTGDKYTTDTARTYSGLNSKAKTELLRAQQAIKTGYEFFKQSQMSAAIENFGTARELFQSNDDLSETLLVTYSMAHASAMQPNFEQGTSILGTLSPTCESKGYKWLQAASHLTSATLKITHSNYSAAVVDGTNALHIFEEIQDHNGQLQSLVQLASLRRSLNDFEGSLGTVQQGMNLAKVEGVNLGQNWAS